MIDMLFKLAVVALAAGFLWVYYTNGQNGRYQPVTTSTPLVLDGREGMVYMSTIEAMPSSND